MHRMWIEEIFGDLKWHEVDLECTMLHHVDRLSCLILTVVLHYAWSVSTGARTIQKDADLFTLLTFFQPESHERSL